MTPCANDNWVRRFSVTDPRKHTKGFTIYKVTSIVFPKGSPEAATKVVVWKRYNDFKKLHHELQQKHKKLYLRGKFPSFAEAKFFRRFEDDVIEERRKCATVLLEFIGAHPALFTSNVFVKFFETGYNQDDCKELDNSPEQHNNTCLGASSLVQSDSVCPANSRNGLTEVKSQGNGPLLKLGGTWQFPKVSDSISLSSHSSEEPTSCTDTDSVLSGPRAPLQRKETEILLPNNVEQSDSPLTSTPSSEIQASSSTPENPLQGHQDYMVQANHHIMQALRHEATGAYDAAFSLLKLGISCLLTGVQDETDTTRRHAVRNKASEYLAAAEKLYNEHLAPRFPSHTQLACASQPAACPLSDLQAFKVLGVIGKVMLAMSTEEDQCYIVKVLHKSPCPVNKCQVPVLPRNVPYMVKLHFYFETDCGVFLFLQHASGGRLWDHISSYLQSQPSTPIHLLSRGNVYLGRKLIEEPPDIVNDALADSDLLAAHDDSYATLIQNYREGKFQINSEKNCTKSALCPNVSENPVDQKNKESSFGSYPREETDSKDCSEVELEVPTTNPSLFNPSEDICMTDLVHGVDSKCVEDLETKELMRNAQQLLQSVNETLLKTSVDDHSILNDILVTESIVPEEHSGRTKQHLKCLSSRRRLSGTRLSLERRVSNDDLFDVRSVCGGGSLHQWEKPAPRLPEALVRQWAEQLVVCLASLHESGLVFRDLYPDNVLLSERGHILLTFTCSWPAVDSVVSREAVQNLYAAPEVTSIFEPTPAVDWWSLGVLLYELITSKPLHMSQPGGVHSHSILSFPDFVSAEAQSLLTELLRYHPQERLGTGVGGVEEIKSHPFFAGTDWSAVCMAGLKTYA